MFAQLFLGIGKMAGMTSPWPLNDPRRIVNFYPLFDRYECDFELVAGAPGHNMDVAQAARIFPNVHAGGLWWYNFRPSTYRHHAGSPRSRARLQERDRRQRRPMHRVVLHPRRCWSSGLLADFLHEQVQGGWINEADAMWVARKWLPRCGRATLLRTTDAFRSFRVGRLAGRVASSGGRSNSMSNSFTLNRRVIGLSEPIASFNVCGARPCPVSAD
jgi:hypothetical protein